MDDEIFDALSKFDEGVRILVISDSCHSGTVTRALRSQSEDIADTDEIEKALLEEGWRSKELPDSLVRQLKSDHFDDYDKIQEYYKKLSPKKEVEASVKLFAACQDEQVTYDGDQNGRFTGLIKKIIYSKEWAELTNSDLFIDRLRNEYIYPRPNYYFYGASNPAFDHNFPFIIDAALPTDPQNTPIPEEPPKKDTSNTISSPQVALKQEAEFLKVRLAK